MSTSIYILEFKKGIKIGVSGDPAKRIKSIEYQLKEKPSRIYISKPHNNAFSIEKRCHALLNKFLNGGYGPGKKYKNEIFNYKFNKAKWILDNTIATCRQSGFYEKSFWENAKCRTSRYPGAPGTKKIIKIAKALGIYDRLIKIRRYEGPYGEIRMTVEILI